jgi:hypothetical protein
MLIPIGHENMEARRWPVITIGLIVLNTVIFLITHGTMEQQSPELGSTKAHIILLAGMHPELNMPAEARQLVDDFKAENPTEWAQLQSPTRNLIDGWDARIRLMEDPAALQAEMDALGAQYSELSASSLQEKYAFVPAHPRAITYSDGEFPAWRMAAPDREHVVSVAGGFCPRRRVGPSAIHGFLSDCGRGSVAILRLGRIPRASFPAWAPRGPWRR